MYKTITEKQMIYKFKEQITELKKTLQLIN